MAIALVLILHLVPVHELVVVFVCTPALLPYILIVFNGQFGEVVLVEVNLWHVNVQNIEAYDTMGGYLYELAQVVSAKPNLMGMCLPI